MRILIILALVLAFASPIRADHCETWSTTNHSVLGPFIEAEGYYLFFDCWGGPQCRPNPWIYAESNDIPGLQRGDEVVDDTCHGMIAPDTITF